MTDADVVNGNNISELFKKLKDLNVKQIDISVVECLHDKLVKLDHSLHLANSQLQELKKICKQYEERQFTLHSIKDNNEAVVFYTGVQN